MYSKVESRTGHWKTAEDYVIIGSEAEKAEKCPVSESDALTVSEVSDQTSTSLPKVSLACVINHWRNGDASRKDIRIHGISV